MQHMIDPQGFLICIGGAENKGSTEEEQEKNEIDSLRSGILKNVINLMRGNSPTVEVITTASSIPDVYFEQYEIAFRNAGAGEVGHIKIRDRESANDNSYLERIQKADGVMFSGGDQLRLFNALGNSSLAALLLKRYREENFVIAGTSAGAAAMSATMICGGNPTRAFFKGEIKMNDAFGFIPEVIIDTHFEKRGRFARLAQAVVTTGHAGIGLSEDTGVIVERGKKLTAIGSGSVVIIEGYNLLYNNIRQVENGKPISVADLSVHIMACGDQYEIKARQFLPAEITADDMADKDRFVA